MGRNTNRPALLVQGIVGVNTGDVVASISTAIDFDYFGIHAVVATLDVQVTGDGTNWVTVAIQDSTSTTPGTYVTTLTVGKVGVLTGKFMGVRIRQNGATPANGTLCAG